MFKLGAENPHEASVVRPRMVLCIRVVMVALLTLAFAACQGSSGLHDGLAVPSPESVQLSLNLSEVPGGQVSCSVYATSGQSIFQLSTRVQFDPLAVKPVSIERGGLVGEEAVFFSLDGQPGFVPLAFTYHQGDSYSATAGIVAQIGFEVLDASRPANIHLIADQEYSIARDAAANNLPVQLAVMK